PRSQVREYRAPGRAIRSEAGKTERANARPFRLDQGGSRFAGRSFAKFRAGWVRLPLPPPLRGSQSPREARKEVRDVANRPVNLRNPPRREYGIACGGTE